MSDFEYQDQMIQLALECVETLKVSADTTEHQVVKDRITAHRAAIAWLIGEVRGDPSRVADRFIADSAAAGADLRLAQTVGLAVLEAVRHPDRVEDGGRGMGSPWFMFNHNGAASFADACAHNAERLEKYTALQLSKLKGLRRVDDHRMEVVDPSGVPALRGEGFMLALPLVSVAVTPEVATGKTYVELERSALLVALASLPGSPWAEPGVAP